MAPKNLVSLNAVICFLTLFFFSWMALAAPQNLSCRSIFSAQLKTEQDAELISKTFKSEQLKDLHAMMKDLEFTSNQKANAFLEILSSIESITEEDMVSVLAIISEMPYEIKKLIQEKNINFTSLMHTPHALQFIHSGVIGLRLQVSNENNFEQLYSKLLESYSWRYSGIILMSQMMEPLGALGQYATSRMSFYLRNSLPESSTRDEFAAIIPAAMNSHTDVVDPYFSQGLIKPEIYETYNQVFNHFLAIITAQHPQLNATGTHSENTTERQGPQSAVPQESEATESSPSDLAIIGGGKLRHSKPEKDSDNENKSPEPSILEFGRYTTFL